MISNYRLMEEHIRQVEMKIRHAEMDIKRNAEIDGHEVEAPRKSELRILKQFFGDFNELREQIDKYRAVCLGVERIASSRGMSNASKVEKISILVHDVLDI